MAKLLDSRTMDIARTAGISALAASVSDNLFDNLSARYGKKNGFLDTELKKRLSESNIAWIEVSGRSHLRRVG